MSKKSDRALAAREEHLRRERDRESRSPLSRAQLEELLDFLANRIAEHGHRDNLEHTRQWLEANAVEIAPALAFLAEQRLTGDFEIAIGADPNVLFGASGTRIARMPIEEPELVTLIEHLDEGGCDHTTRRARAWLEQRRLPVHETLFALLALGGGCDCEIAMNVEPEMIYPEP